MKPIKIAALGLLVALAPVGTAHADLSLVAKRVTQAKFNVDPRSPFWAAAKAVQVDMLPQTLANPSNPKPAVSRMKVRALHNGAEIGFLLEWQDTTLDDTPRTGKFTDSVAVELPLDAQGAVSPMMGQKGSGGRVNILQWRADWQKEVDKGPVKIRDLFPNMVNDAETMAVYKGQDAEVYSTGKVIGNSFAQPKDRSVIDMMAEGYGSLTPKQRQGACGAGVWDKGTWRVVICRPLNDRGDRNQATLAPGLQTSVAFAVWNGGQGERGSRKAWAPWVPLTVEK